MLFLGTVVNMSSCNVRSWKLTRLVNCLLSNQERRAKKITLDFYRYLTFENGLFILKCEGTYSVRARDYDMG